MYRSDIIAELSKTPYRSKPYKNYQAFQDGAMELLKEMGYELTSEDTGIVAVTWFDRQEPDYGSYKNARQAKEARPSYTPNKEYIKPIDGDVTEWPEDIAQREAAAREEEEEQREYDRMANTLTYEIIRWKRGYKISFHNLIRSDQNRHRRKTITQRTTKAREEKLGLSYDDLAKKMLEDGYVVKNKRDIGVYWDLPTDNIA